MKATGVDYEQKNTNEKKTSIRLPFLAYVKRPISIVPPFTSIMVVNMMSLKKWSKKSLN